MTVLDTEHLVLTDLNTPISSSWIAASILRWFALGMYVPFDLTAIMITAGH